MKARGLVTFGRRGLLSLSLSTTRAESMTSNKPSRPPPRLATPVFFIATVAFFYLKGAHGVAGAERGRASRGWADWPPRR
jgi:hypothetical protein